MRLLLLRKLRNSMNPYRGETNAKNRIHSNGNKFFIYLNNFRTCAIYSKSFKQLNILTKDQILNDFHLFEQYNCYGTLTHS